MPGRREKPADLATFPKVPASPGETTTLVLPFAVLRRAFARVAPFASTDPSKPILNSANLSFEAQDGPGEPLTLRAVATDSYRLGLAEVPVPKANGPEEDAGGAGGEDPAPLDEALTAIVPARALRELARAANSLFGEASAAPAFAVRLTLAQNAAFFELGSEGSGDGAGTPRLLFYASLVGGSYPDYGRLLPESFEREYELDAGALRSALGRARLFGSAAGAAAGRGGPCATLTAITAEEGGLEGPGMEITAAADETGSSRERLEASMKGGDPITEPFSISFGAHYLAEAAGSLGAKKILLKTNGPSSPPSWRRSETSRASTSPTRSSS